MTQRALSTSTQPPQSQPASWRLLAILAALLLSLGGILVRLGDVQVIKRSTLASQANRPVVRTLTVLPRRGTITDRYGLPLAIDVDRQSLYVVPELIDAEQRPVVAAQLAGLTGHPIDTILLALNDTSVRWRLVARGLAPEAAQQVAALEEPALRLMYEPQRAYPQGVLAAYVLGGVNQEGSGIGGVEASYNTVLHGATGIITAEVDALNQPIPLRPIDEQPGHDGADLVLTLDAGLQSVAEATVRAAVERHHAEAGIAIVLDVHGGDIRAMVSYPSYDPNHYADAPPERYGQNPAIARLYEPGSTFKIVTTAAGLQQGAFTPTTTVPDPGVIEREGWSLRNWNGVGNGPITPGQMLYYSSNIGAVHFNDLNGPDSFYHFVDAFGFGHALGVDLAGEADGIVHHPGDPDWSNLLLATNAYGQGIAVTPLQIAQMAATIGNDGVPIVPHIVAKICRKSACDPQTPVRRPRVIAPTVAATIREMLVASANHYVNPAPPDNLWLVPGYAVGAKTGTASIPSADGSYEDNATIGSVVGLVPADRPRYALLVVMIRPQGDVYGLQSALPTFRTLAAHLARSSDVPPAPDLVGPEQAIGVVSQ
jgi:cell division protein FtsI (penicillin-binding protein 3)